MNWLITINQNDYEIDQAFKLGQYIEIPQYEKYQVGDVIYVLVVKNKITYLKYKCEVSKANIELEHENYFGKYHIPNSNVELIETLVQLKYLSELKDDKITSQTLIDNGLDKIPNIPVKLVGIFNDLLIFVENTFSKQQSKENKFISTLNDVIKEHILDKEFEIKKNRFITLFPIDNWRNVELEVLKDNQHLLKTNSFDKIFQGSNYSEIFNDDNSVVLDKFCVNDINEFFAEFRNEIYNYLNDEEKEYGVLSQFNEFKLILNAYYNDQTFLYGEQINNISSYFKISNTEIDILNQLLKDHLQNSFDILSEFSCQDLTVIIFDTFNKLKPIMHLNKKVEKPTTAIDIFLSDHYIERINEILVNKKHLYIENVRNSNIDEISYIVSKSIKPKKIFKLNEFEDLLSIAEKQEWFNFLLLDEIDKFNDKFNIRPIIKKLKDSKHSNIYMLLLNSGEDDFSDIFDVKFEFHSYFYNLKILPEFNVKIKNYLIKIGNKENDIEMVFKVLTEINNIIYNTRYQIPTSILLDDPINLISDSNLIINYKLKRFIDCNQNLEKQKKDEIFLELDKLREYFLSKT